MHKPCLIFYLFIASVAIHSNAFCQITATSNQDSLAVVKKMNEFITAFSNLQWDKFTTFFADDATAFFPPSANVANRADNKVEIENIFQKVFEHTRSNKSSPPYLIIAPRNLKVQMLNNVAIVTFELNDPGMFGRRTIVLEKIKDDWLIKHLHASGIII